MTFKILTDDSRKVIARSNVRTALDESTQNKRVDPLQLEDIYTAPDPESPVIYDRYNDDLCASEDGEDASADFSCDSSDETDQPNDTITDSSRVYRRRSKRLDAKEW